MEKNVPDKFLYLSPSMNHSVYHAALCAAAFGFEVGTNDSVRLGLTDVFTGK